MKIRTACMNVTAFLAVGGLVTAPLTAFADHGDKGKGQGKSKGNGHWKGNENAQANGNWNPAPPKKNGRHDNRDWNKKWSKYDEKRYKLERKYDEQRYKNDREYRDRIDQLNREYGNNYANGYNGNYQSGLDAAAARRAQTKNEWKNIAIAAGLVTAFGLIKHDNRITFAGAAGGLYALWRYEQDRKSQSELDRLRANYFSRPYFVRDGTQYDRRLVTRNGEQYYQFVRH